MVVPGNHDTGTEAAALARAGRGEGETLLEHATLLRGEQVQVAGLTLAGLPHTLDPFHLAWWAHKAEEEEMERRGAGVEGVQVLVSHSPPWGVGDTNRSGRHCGSRGLRRAVEGLGRPPE